VLGSPAEIFTPIFADDETLVFIEDGSLRLARPWSAANLRVVETPLNRLTRVDRAAIAGDRIECIVSGRHPDEPALDLPYLIGVPQGNGRAEAFRLAQSPVYKLYPSLVKGLPVFHAGSEGDTEGIYYFRPDDSGASEHRLCQIRQPSLVTLAANGSRLAFSGIR
jgi:hypothetical protein